MEDKPLRVMITAPQPHDDEAARITAALEAGWDYVHLRYPDLTLRQVKAIIEGVPQKYHCRLKLHGHFELLHEFNLGGLHLNRRCPAAPPQFAGALSASCHNIADIEAAAKSGRFSYVTLSPVFSSISKQGYNPSLTEAGFARALSAAGDMPVVALGGITPGNAAAVVDAGFAGYAVLGYLDAAVDIVDLKRRSDEFFKLK